MAAIRTLLNDVESTKTLEKVITTKYQDQLLLSKGNQYETDIVINENDFPLLSRGAESSGKLVTPAVTPNPGKPMAKQ